MSTNLYLYLLIFVSTDPVQSPFLHLLYHSNAKGVFLLKLVLSILGGQNKNNLLHHNHLNLSYLSSYSANKYSTCFTLLYIDGVAVFSLQSKLFFISRNISRVYHILNDLFKCSVKYLNNNK